MYFLNRVLGLGFLAAAAVGNNLWPFAFFSILPELSGQPLSLNCRTETFASVERPWFSNPFGCMWWTLRSVATRLGRSDRECQHGACASARLSESKRFVHCLLLLLFPS